MSDVTREIEMDSGAIEKEIIRGCKKLMRVPSYWRSSWVGTAHGRYTDYVIVLVPTKGRVEPIVYAREKEMNCYIQVLVHMEDYSDSLYAYTPHFFKRYALRAKHKECSLMEAIRLFEPYSGFLIHKDGDKEVYAIDGGLMLGVRVNKEIVLIRTFVSSDMLRETQLKAYEKVIGFISRVENEGLPFVSESYDLAKSLQEEAKSIYEQFYE